MKRLTAGLRAPSNAAYHTGTCRCIPENADAICYQHRLAIPHRRGEAARAQARGSAGPGSIILDEHAGGRPACKGLVYYAVW